MTTREKLYDKKDKRAKLVKAAGELLNKDDLESYAAKTAEIDQLNTTIEALEKQIQLEENFGGEAAPASGVEKTPKVEKHGMEGQSAKGELSEEAKSFLGGVRKGFAGYEGESVSKGEMKEGVDADGGFIVPKDISTKVIQYRDTLPSLLPYVTVTPVSTNKGEKTFEKRAEDTPFVEVTEDEDSAECDAPKFERLLWDIRNFFGNLPVSKFLMQDTDQNLLRILVRWFGRKYVATANSMILTEILKNAEKDLKDLDGIEDAYIDLGTDFRDTSILHTNDTGLKWLNKLKDKNGRKLIGPDPTEPKRKQLTVGDWIIPIKVWPDKVLKNRSTHVPFVVGDLKEGIEFFDRQKLSMDSSDTAVVGSFNAWTKHARIFKGFLRADCKQRDKAAYINGYIEVSALAAMAAETMQASEPTAESGKKA